MIMMMMNHHWKKKHTHTHTKIRIIYECHLWNVERKKHWNAHVKRSKLMIMIVMRGVVFTGKKTKTKHPIKLSLFVAMIETIDYQSMWNDLNLDRILLFSTHTHTHTQTWLTFQIFFCLALNLGSVHIYHIYNY